MSCFRKRLFLEDIDECSSGLAVDCDGVCVNVPGGFKCDCSNVTGFTSSWNERYCTGNCHFTSDSSLFK